MSSFIRYIIRKTQLIDCHHCTPHEILGITMWACARATEVWEGLHLCCWLIKLSPRSVFLVFASAILGGAPGVFYTKSYLILLLRIIMSKSKVPLCSPIVWYDYMYEYIYVCVCINACFYLPQLFVVSRREFHQVHLRK